MSADDEASARHMLLARLRSSRQFLEISSAEEIRRELVTQALDGLPSAERERILADALTELERRRPRG